MEEKSKRIAGLGRFVNSSFQREGQKKADRFYIILPHDLVKSEQFPFKHLETVIVRLENGKLTVSKVE
jgi:hypothetical protein